MRVLLSCKIVLMLIGILKISKIEKNHEIFPFLCRLISISNTKGGFFMPNKRRFFAALLTALSLVSAPAFAEIDLTPYELPSEYGSSVQVIRPR